MVENPLLGDIITLLFGEAQNYETGNSVTGFL